MPKSPTDALMYPLFAFLAVTLPAPASAAKDSPVGQTPEARARMMIEGNARHLICSEARRAALLSGVDDCWVDDARVVQGIFAGPTESPMRYKLSDYIDLTGLLQPTASPPNFATGLFERAQVKASVVAKLFQWFGIEGSANHRRDAHVVIRFFDPQVKVASGVKAAFYRAFDQHNVAATRGRAQLCESNINITEKLVLAKVQILVSWGSESAAKAALTALKAQTGVEAQFGTVAAMGEWLTITADTPAVIGGHGDASKIILGELCEPCKEPSECSASAATLGWKWEPAQCAWTMPSLMSRQLSEGQEAPLASVCIPNEGAEVVVGGATRLSIGHHHVSNSTAWQESNDCGAPPGNPAPACIEHSGASWKTASGVWHALSGTRVAERLQRGISEIGIRADRASLEEVKNPDPREVHTVATLSVVVRPLRGGREVTLARAN